MSRDNLKNKLKKKVQSGMIYTFGIYKWQKSVHVLYGAEVNFYAIAHSTL